MEMYTNLGNLNLEFIISNSINGVLVAAAAVVVAFLLFILVPMVWPVFVASNSKNPDEKGEREYTISG